MKSISDTLKQLALQKKLTNNVLMSICRNCGFQISTAASKARLIENVASSLETKSLIFNPLKSVKNNGHGDDNFKILSIDMGIKHFAYCKISIKKSQSFKGKPVIDEWNKMNLINWSSSVIPSGATGTLEFTPLNYSKLSNELIFELIYSNGYNPDLILIERQRFRTMGNSNVLENILKSNILENMLFSSLTTLNRYDSTKFQSLLVSSSPLTMTNYWVNYKTMAVNNGKKIDENINSPPNNAENSKKIRIKLVSNWITNNINKDFDRTPITLNNKNLEKETATSNIHLQKILDIKSDSRKLYEFMNFLKKPHSSITNASNSNSRVVQKLLEKEKGDDLADCLLHGLSWFNFEKNKDTIYKTLTGDPASLIEVLNQIEKTHLREIELSLLSN
ncbi:hypothetical protein PACTADRAFT_76741 [Pachysolen tannophilus NRRL Y-2460]|uniref:Mitochondrial resolvase Ydc2 catalytic domain-containing protein n=1 Tax=Pachysolen tannophilus NRRL Y-2460 TaxID=669874 RepID=A0A1E4TQR6_PACTA|nr:hypothetical protein PACTADRAFT_76741 [Pachysolen tannophilus NRRL Y-2460]